jgi:hypothetical protein
MCEQEKFRRIKLSDIPYEIALQSKDNITVIDTHFSYNTIVGSLTVYQESDDTLVVIDWAAYAGIKETNIERIRDYGRKLPEEMAKYFFPRFFNMGLWYRT